MKNFLAKAVIVCCFMGVLGISTNAWALVAVFSCETDQDCKDYDLECHGCEDNICVYQEDCGGDEAADEACECLEDSDCPCGKCVDGCWCDWVEKNECDSDEDCDGGAQCEWGECGNVCMEVDEEGGGVPWSDECANDDECDGCDICFNGECTSAANAEGGDPWMCEDDSNCAEGEYCDYGECGSQCAKKTGDNPWTDLCASSGGDWVECLPGCGMPTCDNPEPGMECDMACMAACECPEWMPYWDEAKGCVGQPYCDELACEAEGKVWDECGTSSCPGCDDCIGTCGCPEGLQENEEGDCVGIKPIDELCDETGGTFNECGSACAPDPCNPDEPVNCPAVCVEMCECPDDKPIWNMAKGCIAGEIPEPVCDGPGKICEDSGGAWDECAGSSCPTCDDCIADCICPSETVFDNEDGCMEVPEPQDACADTGGSWDCVSDCDPGEDCEAVCYYTCVCPEETPYFSSLKGCMEESVAEGGESVILDPTPSVTIEGEGGRDGCVVSSDGLHVGLLTLFLGLGVFGIGLTLQRRREKAPAKRRKRSQR